MRVDGAAETGSTASLLRWEHIEVQGRPAAYGEAGEGRPVVFLHGWGLGHHAYKRPLKRLVGRHFRVLAPGLPGSGGTADLPMEDRSIVGYAAWVDAFLAAVSVELPAVVIGHSFGGGVAIALAHRFPARVAQLVLVNSVGGAVWGNGPDPRALAERPVWEWGLQIARELLPVHQGLRVALSAREDFIPNLVRNPRALWDVGALARLADLRAELAELRERRVPVLVVSNEADGVVPVSAFESLCGALGIEGRVLPGNHTWLLADPDAFDVVMANVLENQGETVETVSELRQLLVPTTVPAALADELVDTAPALWLSSDSPAELAGDLVLCHPPLGPTEVRARAAVSDAGPWRLTVVAHDRPGLLADTAGVLASEGLSILAASVATWDHIGLALHAVTLPGPAPPPEVMDRLGARLRSIAAGDSPAVEFVPIGQSSVRRSGEANGDAMVTVTAPDQPGLLWAVCRWFADNGASIQAAWVSGHDVVHDVFVVRGAPDLGQLERRLSRPAPPLLFRVAGSLVGASTGAAVRLAAHLSSAISRR